MVYKPEKTTSTTTTSTTTSTTAVPTTTTATTTIKPFHYQLPSTPEAPPSLPHPASTKRLPPKQRPLLYAKRRPGESGTVSKPFEYLSRLSQYLSDRVFTGGTLSIKDWMKATKGVIETIHLGWSTKTPHSNSNQTVSLKYLHITLSLIYQG